MRGRSPIIVSWSLALVVGAAWLLAAPGDPGWEYGRVRCGKRAGFTSAAACMGCCNLGFASGALNEAQWWDCKSYCLAICWFCEEAPPDE